MAANPHPALLAPIPENVPEEMRRLRRWAPWRAEWDEKKQKWIKIPHRAARPEYGLSNKNATGWVTFDEAMAAYKANPKLFAGVGYLMTGPHGVTGVDMDKCRNPTTGELDDWAAELVAKLDTYTEVSPSGTGLHAMVAGDVPEDWTNHERGIEVYGGNEARFLCVTGLRVAGAPPTLRPPRAGVLDEVATRYRKAKTRAEVEDLHLPTLVPVDDLPALSELDLPPHAVNFLTEGPDVGDRSRQLFATAIALCDVLEPAQALSILEANDFAMEVALDHRRQDYDKALRYLWKQCQQGKARGEQIRAEGFDAFDELDRLDEPAFAGMGIAEAWVDEADDILGPAAPAAPGATGTALDDFDVLPDEQDPRGRDLGPIATPSTRPPRFTPILPAQFLQRPPMKWIVQGVLPKAALGVIFGQSTAGKTFFTLDLVAAICRGVPWRGKRTTGGRGVYIVAEGAEGFRNRMQAYCEYHGVEVGSLALGVIPDAPNLMDKAQVKELILALKAFGPVDFIVVDTYSRVMVGGNENDAKDAGTMVNHCARIHAATGAMVILVHHSGKDPSSGARGSSVLKAAADVEIEVIRTKEYRAAKVAKMKDGDDSGEFRFNLPIVELGETEDGDPITSCVVQHRDTPEGASADLGAEGLRGLPLTVYTTLAGMIDLAGDVTYPEAIDGCVAHLPAPEKGGHDRRRDNVIRALDKLLDSGRLEKVGSYIALGNTK